MHTEARRTLASSFLILAVVTVAACSPGTLPGSPSAVTVGGGAARYNGTITTRRVAGNYSIAEGTQGLSLSLIIHGTDQIQGRVDSGGGGSLNGTITGNLASGTFQATLLIVTPAQQGGASTNCEGRGDASGILTGLNLVISASSVTYGNCPGLTTSSQGQAVAVSPIPGSSPNRANVVISIIGGAHVARGTCAGGVSGFPFTVEIAETNGINVTLDPTFVAEERHGGGGITTATLDLPFTDLPGGARRTYDVCTLTAGTYQAFITGADGGGNRIRTASPVVTFN